MPPRPTFSLFGFNHTQAYVPGPYAERILEQKHVAIYPKIVDTYKNRERTGLWISIFANTKVVKRVVRSHATRQMTRALTEALKLQGFSPVGHSLDPSKEDLKGSLVFYPTAFFDILEQRDQLRKEMQDLVQWLHKSQSEPKVLYRKTTRLSIDTMGRTFAEPQPESSMVDEGSGNSEDQTISFPKFAPIKREDDLPDHKGKTRKHKENQARRTHSSPSRKS